MSVCKVWVFIYLLIYLDDMSGFLVKFSGIRPRGKFANSTMAGLDFHTHGWKGLV